MNIEPPDDKVYFAYAKILQDSLLRDMRVRPVRNHRPQGETASLTDEEEAMLDRELAYFG